ncbi:MAG: hypothetical protein JO186_07475 [Actinobacteria bacterium]|nr:hypothetical protein [Actinomycetota bacterium]
MPLGLWHVTYAEAVWTTNESLPAALSFACGVPESAPWLEKVAEEARACAR